MSNNLRFHELVDLYFADIECTSAEAPFAKVIKEINKISDMYADAYSILVHHVRDKSITLTARRRLSTVIEIIESKHFQRCAIERVITNNRHAGLYLRGTNG